MTNKNKITKGLAKIVLTTGLVLGSLGISGCDTQSNNGSQTNYRTYSQKQPEYKSGIGMTYDGKLGYSPCDGIVIPFDGGGVKPGFGF